MSYVPHTDLDVQKMLKTIGVQSVDELFSDIPDSVQLDRLLDIPGSLTEPELLTELQNIAGRNNCFPQDRSFLGGGANRHYIPVIVDHIISRSEFYTAYTPYQPEISQGTLQSIFEFQSLIGFLTGMEVSNASMYDGASASAEAALMAMRITRKNKLLVSRALHPMYQQVMNTYVKHQNAELISLSLETDGGDSFADIESRLDDSVAACCIQYPNFFGILEDFKRIADIVHQKKALLVVVVTEPIALGLVTPPGELGADIVVGDAQSFGIPTNFGGPYVGFLATLKKYVRQMPGRLVGETVDTEGRRGYVLTLSTREQHIRREKATSNICTNQGLCALAAAITMTAFGKNGLRTLAETNMAKCEYLKTSLKDIQFLSFPFSGPTFNEFVVKTNSDEIELLSYLKQHGFLGGLPLRQYSEDLTGLLLLSVTEVNTKNEIDAFVQCLKNYKR